MVDFTKFIPEGVVPPEVFKLSRQIDTIKSELENGIELPDDYAGFSFHAYNTQPLPTETLTPEQILKFRDESYLEYHQSEKFLSKVKEKYGQGIFE